MKISHRIYKRNDRWYCDIRINKGNGATPRRERYSAGRTKAEAVSFCTKKLMEIEKLHQMTSFSKDIVSSPFREYALDWLEYKDVEAKTKDQYSNGITNYAIPEIGEIPLYEITKADIFRVKDKINKGAKGQGRHKNNLMTGIKSLFGHAFERGHIIINPTATIKRFKEPKPEVDPFSSLEVNKFMENVDPFYRDYFFLAFSRGMRHSEIIPLKVKNIDLANKYILVRTGYKAMTRTEGELKTQSSIRDIEMDDELYHSLFNRLSTMSDHNQYIFTCEQGNRLTSERLREVFKDTLIKSGLRMRKLMQTRHSFASIAISSGEDVYWVMRILGHTTLQMIHEHYGRWIRNRNRVDGVAFRKMFLAPISQETIPLADNLAVNPNRPTHIPHPTSKTPQ